MKKVNTWQRAGVGLMAACYVLGSAVDAAAQFPTPSLTPTTYFQTESSGPFLSVTQAVAFSSTQDVPEFRFLFGFATDETVAPDVFLDSLTFSVSDTASSLFAILGTADASGMHWAPVSPGTVYLDPELVSFVAVPWPEDLSVSVTATQRFAFAVDVRLPEVFRSEQLLVYSDFFNNQNGAQSMSFVGPFVSVPEPATWALLATALVFVFALKWRSE